ncbi:hypothetical protein TSMEX_001469 [Taenia solium]|eukprot:TsM_000743500 transcript=TsM_000743500 gene=TsM_000743500
MTRVIELLAEQIPSVAIFVPSFINPERLCTITEILFGSDVVNASENNESLAAVERESYSTFFISNGDFAMHKNEVLNATRGRAIDASTLKTSWVDFRQPSKEEVNLDWKTLPTPYPFVGQLNTAIKYRGFTTICDFLEKKSTK